ncbi:MAG: O-antigen ligase family protein [Acidobacteriota bacterium]
MKSSVKNRPANPSTFSLDYLKTPLNLPILIFIGFILLQLIPLPEPVLKAVSPNTHEIYIDSQNAINQISNEQLSSEKSVGSRSLSLNPYTTRNELYKIVAYTLLFFLIINNIHSFQKIRRILTYIVIFAFSLSLFAIIQKLTWNGKIYWFRELRYGGDPFGPYVNHNHYSGYMEMVIPLAIGLIFLNKDINKRLMLGFMTIVMAGTVFMSLSRAGMISLICSLVFLSLMLSSKTNPKHRFPIVSLIVISLLLFLAYTGILSNSLNRILTLTEPDKLLQETRPKIWKDSLYYFKDFPIFGSGLGTFENAFPKYKSFSPRSIYLYAHNDYLQAIAECGALGFVIILWGIITFFRTIFQHVKKDPMSLCLVTSVVAIAIHSLFDFNLHIPANAAIFSIIIGFIFGWKYARGYGKAAVDEKQL